ncbi:hypothetical protein AA650_06615 [Anabaena sp. WA102]|nr:hypothetical protein AA650_06615 [Anabaena sp. WA102]
MAKIVQGIAINFVKFCISLGDLFLKPLSIKGFRLTSSKRSKIENNSPIMKFSEIIANRGKYCNLVDK